jgi:hypothetical protein
MAAKLRKPIPNRPFYISDSDEVNWKWTDAFNAGVQVVGPNYGISQAQLDQVAAATLVIAAFMGRLTRAKEYYEACVTTKDGYISTDPNYPPGPVPFAKPPVEGVAPLPLPSNILKVFIQVAEAILLQNPSEADRILLGLVPAKGKPVPPDHKPRQKAADTNYPQLKYNVQDSTISIMVKRGDIYKGKMLRLIVDKEGRGEYVEAGITNTGTFTIPFTLPAGVQAGVWVLKGTFMEGQHLIGEWSPELVVPLKRPVQPGMSELLSVAVADVNENVVPSSNGHEAVMS